jgi:hypothetical protein
MSFLRGPERPVATMAKNFLDEVRFNRRSSDRRSSEKFGEEFI